MRILLRVYERGWAIAILMIAVALSPSAIEDAPSLCLFRRITGHPCLGCGMTRAFVSLAHGDSDAAVRHNGLVVVVFPVIAAQAAFQLIRLLKECRTDRASLSVSSRATP